MPGKQAKMLSDDNIEDLLLYAAQTRYPRRNRVVALLSVKAGLRAGEIAKLTWEMVIAADGTINTVIELRNHAAKKGSGRLIPIHADLRDALVAWRKLTDGRGSVIRSERGATMVPGSIVLWFKIAYRAIGLNGCSSHSGRRTFITRAARLVPMPIPPRLVAHMRRWVATGAVTSHFVEWAGQPVRSVKMAFNSAVRLAGLSGDVTPHTLRHTAAT